MLTLAVAVATAIPLVALFAIYRLDRFGTRAFRLVLMCTGWGIIATQVALAVNTAVLDSGLVAGPTITRVVAPVVEEVAKGLIILYLVLRPRFTYFVDGAIYGFAVGIGFAVVENYHYLWTHQQAALTLAAGRVLSTNLMHASTTALTGIALGLARFEAEGRRRAAISLAGLGLAMLMHIVFNTMVTRYSGSITVLYVLAAGYGLSGTLAIALAIRYGLNQAEGWIRPALTASKQVAKGEIAAVEALEHESTESAVLGAVEARFGEHMAHHVRHLLHLEARMAILLQTRGHLPDGTAQREVDEELARLHVELDERRRAIGVFCMLHVRSIAPDVSGPLWQSLAVGLHGASAATAASGETATSGKVPTLRAGPASGVDIWKSLDKRTAPRKKWSLPWRRKRSPAAPPPDGPARRMTPRARFGWAALLYLVATAALWLAPRALDLSGIGPPPWAAVPEPALARIALQWLLTLILLAFVAPRRLVHRRGPGRRDLWQRASRRLEERARRGGLAHRLASKSGRLVVLSLLAGASLLAWTSALWLRSPAWAAHPERIAILWLVQVALILTAAVARRRIHVLPWLATLIAIGAAIAELAGR